MPNSIRAVRYDQKDNKYKAVINRTMTEAFREDVVKEIESIWDNNFPKGINFFGKSHKVYPSKKSMLESLEIIRKLCVKVIKDYTDAAKELVSNIEEEEKDCQMK